MNDAQLDTVQTYIQLVSLVAIAIPIATYAGYWVWITHPEQPPSNGRQKYWYALYAAIAIFIAMSAFS
jgi:hypothetical protein